MPGEYRAWRSMIRMVTFAEFIGMHCVQNMADVAQYLRMIIFRGCLHPQARNPQHVEKEADEQFQARMARIMR